MRCSRVKFLVSRVAVLASTTVYSKKKERKKESIHNPNNNLPAENATERRKMQSARIGIPADTQWQNRLPKCRRSRSRGSKSSNMEDEDRVHRERREREREGEPWALYPTRFWVSAGSGNQKKLCFAGKKEKKKKVETVKNKIHTFFQKCMAQKYSGIRLEFLN
jgi:hypothetical protein